MTNLPASEEAYAGGIPQKTPTIKQSLSQEDITNLSPFAGVVYVTHFFGLNLTHLHRPEVDDEEENIQGRFWKRHRTLDNVVSHLLLALPPHLRLPGGVRDPNIVFVNFAGRFFHRLVLIDLADCDSAHTSAICLHQAAIFKAQRNKLPNQIIEKSRERCLNSAAEVVNIMRMTSHLDVATV